MNKGFTLIELLAVVVLIAVIASIATLSIDLSVKSHRDKLSDIQIQEIEESAEAYYLEEAIDSLDYEREIVKTCVNVDYLIENGYIDSEELVDPSGDNALNGSVKITYDSNEYSFEYQDNTCSNSDMGIVCEAVTSSTVTTGNVSEGNYLPGDEYVCEVKEGTKYHFFILSINSDDTINLIMNANINSKGEVVNSETSDKGLIAWQTSGQNKDGPITIITFLHNISKNWVNIPSLNWTYEDKKTVGGEFGYESIVVSNGVAVITSGTEPAVTTQIGTKQEPLRVRLPLRSELSKKDDTNLYLYDNLDSTGDTLPYGYWSLSTYVNSNIGVWFVKWDGNLSSTSVNNASYWGARPVITLSKKYISN